MGIYFILAEASAMPGEKDLEDNVRRSNKTITVQIHTIHIRADGSVDPLTVPISTVDNVTYTLTSSIYDYPVVVERDDIIFDGNGHALEGFGDGWGLFLSGTNNVTIQNVNVKKFDYGIWFNLSSFNTVSRNNITNNNSGIRLDLSSNNSIFANEVTNNHLGGIWLRHSSNYNNIIRNIITSNGDGISIEESSNNNVSQNNITNNNWHGIELWHSSHNNVSENIIISNGDGLGIIGSPNNNISGNNITNNRVGISFYSSNNNVSGNNITNNNWGISLFESLNNNISGNNITNNEEYGIELWSSSSNNIFANEVTSNGFGIWLRYASNYNSIFANEVTDNEQGIWLHTSSNNTIYHNNFVDNTQHVYDSSKEPPWFSPSINTWDDGYPSGGNYWSDYEKIYPNATEIDDSRIWDTPYLIDENNQDNYPLMEPWSLTPPSPVEATQELIETLETLNLPKGTENSLKAKLKVAIHMLDMGKEEGAIHKLSVFINRVEMLREKTLTNEQADYLIAEAQRIRHLING